MLYHQLPDIITKALRERHGPMRYLKPPGTHPHLTCKTQEKDPRFDYSKDPVSW